MKKKVTAFLLASFMALATVAAPSFALTPDEQRQIDNIAKCRAYPVPWNPACWAVGQDFYNDWINPPEVY